MALKCELLDECGFFAKYQPAKDAGCRWLIQEYCRGPRMAECKRREYREKHGTPPPDDMMPSGRNVPA